MIPECDICQEPTEVSNNGNNKQSSPATKSYADSTGFSQTDVPRILREFVESQPQLGLWLSQTRNKAADISMKMLLKEVDKESDTELKDIRLDTPRTFSSIPFFDNINGPKRLESILTAYYIHNRDVGYVQGMNLIAGFLLLLIEFALGSKTSDERDEQILCSLTELVENEKYNKGYYSKADNLLHLKVDFAVLDLLTKEFLPNVYETLTRNATMRIYITSVLASRWFLTIFIDDVPIETLCEIWGLYLQHGYPVLFWVAIALFEGCQAEIVKSNDVEIITVVQNHSRVISPAALLKSAFFSELQSIITCQKISSMRTYVLKNKEKFLDMFAVGNYRSNYCCDVDMLDCIIS